MGFLSRKETQRWRFSGSKLVVFLASWPGFRFSPPPPPERNHTPQATDFSVVCEVFMIPLGGKGGRESFASGRALCAPSGVSREPFCGSSVGSLRPLPRAFLWASRLLGPLVAIFGSRRAASNPLTFTSFSQTVFSTNSSRERLLKTT